MHGKLYLIVVFILVFVTQCVYSQNSNDSIYIFTPIKQTKPLSVTWNYYVWAGGGVHHSSNVKTANNVKGASVYGNFTNIGTSIEAKVNNVIGFQYGIGYKNEPYANKNDFFSKSAMESHWLTNDFQLSWVGIEVGLLYDILLSSKMRSGNNFDFVAINSDCLNSSAWASYLGACWNINPIKVEIRGGLVCKPKLDPDKIAYYNLQKTQTGRLYFAVNLSYKLFTTGKKISDVSVY